MKARAGDTPMSGAEDANERLGELLARARRDGRLAIDTEFMGEGRYRTLLCLIQLAVPAHGDADNDRGAGNDGDANNDGNTNNHGNAGNGDDAVNGGDARDEDATLIVDPLAEGFDGAGLARALADPAIEIVMHAGRQDVALLRRVLATEVTNIFDTQLAAGFAGMPAQASYDSLLSEVIGLRVAKSASFTRWDARPLSDEQLGYAREDVLHLLELASALKDRLRERGRLQWAREECAGLAQASDERDLEAIFERLPRIGSLNARARTTARELVRWRERTAERQDRPVQSVLSDAGLVEVAKRSPASREDLGKLRGVGASSGGRLAEELLDVVRRARRQPPEEAPAQVRPPAGRPEDAPLIALAEALVRAVARESGLAYELLAARADLQAIVAAVRTGSAEPDVRTIRGWRRELVGEQVLALLDGRVSLSVERSGRATRVLVSPVTTGSPAEPTG